MSAPVQLRIAAELPIDPVATAELSILERGRLYDALDLDALQRQAVEEAVRLVIAKTYGGRRAA